ncbi:MAG: efflux transporter outer membrane subunit [Rhodocyclaceae bacterium]|nr:efflux transporter outer membrane subunit [Rhodocyclaceae bacterium]
MALALAGCASLAPRTELPAPPVAGAFPGDTGGGGTPASAIEWQRFFADERLRALIGLALENNRDLRIAVLNIEQARAAFDVRRADRLPTVGAGLSGSRQPKGDGGINSLYSAGLQVSAYELDLFGRVSSLADAALAQYLATEEARKAVQISLVASVATLYLSIQGDEELLRVTRQTLDTREESYRLTRLRFDNGVSSMLEVRQAETLLESARAALAQFTRQRALDQNALVLLVGQPLPPGLPSQAALAADVTRTLGIPDLPAGIPSEVLARRPDVRQAEQLLRAADANIGAARAAFFPRITLTGSLGMASSQLNGLFSSGLAWSFAPQLLQPIFDAGRNRANQQVAEASQRIALAQYERTVQVAFREVADALAGRETFAEQLRAQQAQVRAEQDRFTLAELGFRNGVRSYLELLDAQRSLFTAQQTEVSLRTQYAQNLVTLYRVLGGGWSPDP